MVSPARTTPPPILITGAARSGTSMTAGIVALCGAFGGFLSGPNRHNQRGMFENGAIRDQMVKPFLREIDADPMGQRPLPDIDLCHQIAAVTAPKWYESVWRVMINQGYAGVQPWFYKGAKMCLIWPIWHAAFADAKWIIVRRDRRDIAQSCVRTSFMRAYVGEQGWLQWAEAHERRFEEMRAGGCSIREVWSQRVIDGDFEEIKPVIEWAGLTWQEEQARAFVDPALWKRGK